MASTLQEIKAQIIAAKNANTALAGLNSPSLTAIWLLWIDTIANVLLVQQQLQDAFVAEVEAKIAQSLWGTAPWFIAIAKKFQLGDAVEQLANNEPYSIIDTAKQIVTLASFREGLGVLTIKVAKGTPATAQALSGSELIQFRSYMNKMKPAGAVLNCISLDADKLRVTATINYDGQYGLVDIQARVLTAIQDFLFNLPFDGTFYKNKLIDAIDNVAGVINIDQDLASLTAVQGAVTSAIGTSYIPQAGYMRFDEAFSTLTYIAV